MGEIKQGSLSEGTVLKGMLGGRLKVKKYLAEGGQGEVYKVEYGNTDKALKWYKKSVIEKMGDSADKFYDNLKENVMRGTPSKEFLWPEDITEWVDGTFGYIMDLRPDEYHDISEFLLPKTTGIKFPSFRVATDAAMHIVSAFRILHNKGYSYQDLNDGNFFINPDNGKVLICDNDNVAPDGTITGIVGKPRYIAPEVVRCETMPIAETDLFYMGVILYMLYTVNHPLEGKHLKNTTTSSDQEKLYGEYPVFMWDPEDDSNAPDPVMNINSIAVWPELPEYIKELFYATFSKKSMQGGGGRPAEIKWLKALARFRSEIVSCECGEEVFINNGVSEKCSGCGHAINIPFKLALGEYELPAKTGTRIYKCQVKIGCNADIALDPIAEVVESKDGQRYGIRNRSEKRWDAVSSKGEAKKVGINDVIPLKDGISFTAEDATVKICKN